MNALEFSQYALIGITIGLLVLPLRYAYFLLLISSLFDASGPGFGSASQIGILNSIKVLVAPIIIIIRLKMKPIRRVFVGKGRSILLLFLMLTFYASLAALWSSWQLSALKMIGYLTGYILWFAVISYGWYKGYITRNSMTAILIAAVLLAILQSRVLEPVFGVYQYAPQRFTAFTSPQAYAGFVVILVAILLLGFPRQRLFASWLFLVIGVIVIVLSGSRYAIVSLLFVFIVFMLRNVNATRAHPAVLNLSISILLSSILLSLTLASNMGFRLSVISIPGLEKTRIGELRYIFAEQSEIGTWAWRLSMYQNAISAFESASVLAKLFGHGTASGADVALTADPFRYAASTIDANRVIHNEFLRALYEWGVVGFFILLAMVLHLFVLSFGLLLQRDFLLLAILPLIVISLSIENVLAGAGSAWGTGILIALGKIRWHYKIKKSHKT